MGNNCKIPWVSGQKGGIKDKLGKKRKDSRCDTSSIRERRASEDREKHADRSWRMTEVVVLLSF